MPVHEGSRLLQLWFVLLRYDQEAMLVGMDELARSLQILILDLLTRFHIKINAKCFTFKNLQRRG